MIDEISSERIAQRLESAYCHWDLHRAAVQAQPEVKSTPPRAFSIAISREAGTHGSAVAEEVGRRLNWQVYDHQLLDAVAKDIGVRTKLLESIDEKHTSWLLENFKRAFAVPLVSEPGYVHHFARTMLALSVHGECVIVGRGAAQILPAANTVRVRLMAPLQDRIAVIARERGKRPEEAKEFVATADQDHIAFIRDNFQKDPTEPHEYDQILNTARFSVTQCAGLIIQGLHDLQSNIA